MRAFLRVALVVLVAIAAGGCVNRHGDFTVLSNKLVRTSDLELSAAERVRDVEGRDVQHIIFFIPIGSPPVLEEAIDDGLRKGGGDVFTDAVIYQWSWYIPLLYGQAGWRVEGDVVRTRR